VRLSAIFREAGLKDMAVTDADLGVLAQYLPVCEGFDLSHCAGLSNTSLHSIGTVHTHTHTHTYSYIHILIHTHTYTYSYILNHTHTNTYTYSYIHTYIHIHIQLYILLPQTA
jgi:hypothetical protein